MIELVSLWGLYASSSRDPDSAAWPLKRWSIAVCTTRFSGAVIDESLNAVVSCKAIAASKPIRLATFLAKEEIMPFATSSSVAPTMAARAAKKPLMSLISLTKSATLKFTGMVADDGRHEI